VRVERAKPAAGTWKRYAGIVGTVVSVNTRDHEVGVRLDGGRVVWFAFDELVGL
jgi:hypothetical protein